ncbi:SdpI family protein [Clostridium perfringens]|nr:SdpI family protein [Clostridium perfringens]
MAIFLIGSIIIMGSLYYKGVPSKINGLIGYRTKASMSSDEAWKAANNLVGKLAISLGIVFLVINLSVLFICMYLKTGERSLLLGYLPLITFVLEMIIIISKTQSYLKQNFDSLGKKLNK